jgi:hypothetical protein
MLTATMFVLAAQAVQPAPPEIDRYNLVWTTPSADASGSMPIGNGTLGANVWVEKNGDLVLLLSRTDAWSETDRLLKLGRVRVRLEPNPFTAAGFRQELKLAEGRIELSEPEAQARVVVYVTPTVDQIRVEGRTATPVKVTATLENWRTAKKTFENDDDLKSSWTMNAAPSEVRRDLVWESPDVVTTFTDNLRTGVQWYHRNEHSVVPFTLKHQGLESIKGQFKDPLIHRTFGGVMEGLPLVKDKPGTLASDGPVTWFSVKVTTHAAQTESVEQWSKKARDLGTPVPGPDVAMAETAAWWSKFWDRSWVYVEGDKSNVAGSGKLVPKNDHPLRIGADSNGQNVYRGKIGTYGGYKGVLSEESISQLSTAERTGTPPKIETLLFGRARPKHGHSILDPLNLNQAMRVGAVDRGPSGGGNHSLNGGHLVIRPEHAEFVDSFTLSAHIKPDADLGPARIFDKMTAGGSDGFIFDTHPGDSLRLIVGDLTVHARGVLKRGEWQHVAATYDAATGIGTIYLDGKPVASNNPLVEDAAPPSRVTQAYILQRWVQASGGGPREGSQTPGDYPIKFNGSIFTVEPAVTEGQPHNPDWRKWGGSFWWQNTRLPYYSMLASGDTEMMEPLFRFYENALPGSKARTTLYYGAQGVYWPETITTFGTYANGDYGWKRDGLAPGDISPCPWWQWSWNSSLELSQLMLDRAAYSGDAKFLSERALPMARETLLYFDTRFKRDANGKFLITPTQAVETYWHGVTNDAPVVGGLHTICDQLLALPTTVGTAEDRALWRRVKDATPALPTWEQKGVKMAAPAETFKNQRSNCETAELYPLWPFNEYALGKPNLDLAIAAYRARVDKSSVGWTQDGLFAARLGLTDEAKTQLLARVGNSHKNHRFPAIWGPNFDWLPDQCHGSNILTQTQLMLMQADPVTGKILLLPAWPKDWNVSFKLHAPRQTTVECVYRNGTIEKLVVTPESRRADVTLPAGVTVK